MRFAENVDGPFVRDAEFVRDTEEVGLRDDELTGRVSEPSVDR